MRVLEKAACARIDRSFPEKLALKTRKGCSEHQAPLTSHFAAIRNSSKGIMERLAWA